MRNGAGPFISGSDADVSLEYSAISIITVDFTAQTRINLKAPLKIPNPIKIRSLTPLDFAKHACLKNNLNAQRFELTDTFFSLSGQV